MGPAVSNDNTADSPAAFSARLRGILDISVQTPSAFLHKCCPSLASGPPGANSGDSETPPDATLLAGLLLRSVLRWGAKLAA